MCRICVKTGRVMSYSRHVDFSMCSKNSRVMMEEAKLKL